MARRAPTLIVAAVRERHIDVLALQELSTDLIKRLERGGLHRILPYRQLGTPREKTDNGGFNGIWSRTKPKRGTHGIVSIPAADVPGIMLQTDDGIRRGIRIRARPDRRCAAVGNGRTASGP